MSVGNQFIWEDLLEYIDDRRVVPIIGWDVLHFDLGEQKATLDRVIATRMAQRLGLPPPDAAQADPLNDLVCRHEAAGGRADQLFPRLRAVLRDRLPTPTSLQHLASIRHFKLFVTTTFDSLMEQAIDEHPSSEGITTTSLAYSLAGQDDLAPDEGRMGEPVVYHLLGRSSSTVPDCVLSQEHMLECFHHLQRHGLPERLADVLRQNHLLLIGNRLSDWLVRFLIRMAKGERLITPRGCSEILAAPTMGQHQELVGFLRSFSPSTQLYTQGDAPGFIAELARRYAQRHPPGGNNDDKPSVGATAAEPANMSPGAVFISYASQDIAAARQLHSDLEAAGIDAWFDKRALHGGDDFGGSISRSIRSCSLFVPLVSSNTQDRVEGYFRQEWNLAAERSLRMDESVRFILPVVIDNTSSDESARVPDRFRRLHWMRLPGGRCDGQFVDYVKSLVREAHRRQRAAR